MRKAVVANPSRLPRWTDEEVVALRKRYARHRGKLTHEEMARRIGAPLTTVRHMLNGTTYKHVGQKVAKRLHATKSRRWSPATVRKMRLLYPKPGVSLKSLAAEFGGDAANAARMLTGECYGDVPGALNKLKPKGYDDAARAKAKKKNRILPDEVALFIRLIYRPGLISSQKIATAYGIDQASVCRIINGDIYKDVPLVADTTNAFGVRRRLSDAQVIQARDWARRGIKTEKYIAEWCGIARSAVCAMLRGKTYAHIPGAVPQSMWSLKHRKGKPIKHRPPRLIEDDERIDLVEARKLRHAA